MTGGENNSFKKLEEEQEKEFSKNVDKVKKSIDGNLSGLSFITNIIDLYFARVVSYMVDVTRGGGSTEESTEEENDVLE